MKKYKLVKEYPGSPKLGTEFEYWTDGISEQIYNKSTNPSFIPLKTVKDYSEFWEQAIEDDYEILSILGGVTQSFYILDKETGLYVNKAEYAKFTISELLRQDCTIHLVKRLSDGEIFTVGDKVQLIPGDWKDQNTILSKIEIKDNVVVFEITQEKYKSKYSQGIQDWRKTKKPLFTTEDGVEVFEGDSFYFVTKSFLIERTTTIKLKQSDKTFSTREAANEYILDNKPDLSINDIRKVMPIGADEMEKLKKIVRL